MADLLDYLPAALNRHVSREEIALSLSTSRATIDRRRTDGFTINEIVRALDHFGLSRTAGLINLGVLDRAQVVAEAGAEGALVECTSTAALAEEIARRLKQPTTTAPPANA